MSDVAIARIIASYDSRIVRAYCRARFMILRQRFLDEIGQYLPPEGRILDIGCGFGLFSLYYGMTSKARQIHGFDLDARRIAIAKKAAERLAVTNVTYEQADACQRFCSQGLDAVYIMDLVHHIHPEFVRPLLMSVRQGLSPGGILIIKDVGTVPRYKKLFTFVLDKAMDYRAHVHYWPAEKIRLLLAEVGFSTYRHTMVDFLPYPHELYLCKPT